MHPTGTPSSLVLVASSTQASSGGGCSPPDFGMVRGIIPDKDITASSAQNPDSYAKYARLSNSKAWVPDEKDREPWIQVNLQYSRNITAIATQGFSGFYVTRYYVSFSSDGNNWNNHTEQGKVKVFQANVNDSNTKTVLLRPSHVAQYVRLHPTNCSNTCALRFELYGCNSTTAPTPPRNLKVTVESSTSIKASWTEPLKFNGVLRRYVVMYGLSEDSLNRRVYSPITEYSLTRLNEFTTYYVQVYAETSVSGASSKIVPATTEEDAPSSAPVIDGQETKAEDAHTIRVKWNEIAKEDQNGLILGYEVLYKEKDQQRNFRLNASTTNTIIERLKPYTEYCIQVQGFTKVGKSPLSSCFNVRTLDKGPGPPKEFRAQVIIENEVHLTWKEPENSNGIVRFYYIKIYNTKTGLQFGKLINQSAFKQPNMQQHNRLISDLKYFTDFTFTIQAVTVEPGEMANATARTEEGVPSQPRDVAAKLDEGEMFVTVTWKDPKDHNGIITLYTVYFEGKRTYDTSFTDKHEIVSGNSSQSTKIGIERLKPGTDYGIYVKAKTVKGYGEDSVRVVLKTPSKRPPPPKLPEVVEADVTTTTITISLSASSDTNGEIIRHQIIVEMLGTARARRESTTLPDNIYGYQEAQTNGDRFYIAAMFERRKLPAEFVLGNGKTYGGYENVPLKPGTRYKVYVRGVTERDGKWLYGEPTALSLPETDETPVVKEGDNTVGVMVGVIAGVLGALTLIVIAIVATHLHLRSNRPPNANLKVESQKEEFRLRRFSAQVTAVEGDQTQENLALVPVGVTTQLTASESNERRSLETTESIVVYEEIDLFSPGMMVLNGSGQTPEVSRACSRIYTPLEKREEEEHEYANQINPPEYMNTYMPLIKGGNFKMLADNSPEYASDL